MHDAGNAFGKWYEEATMLCVFKDMSDDSSNEIMVSASSLSAPRSRFSACGDMVRRMRAQCTRSREDLIGNAALFTVLKDALVYLQDHNDQNDQEYKTRLPCVPCRRVLPTASQ